MNLSKFTLLFLAFGSSCTTPTINTNMKHNTNNNIIKLESSKPTPTPSTMAMFHIIEENGNYQTANGDIKKGVIVKIYSTDDATKPSHHVGEGSEFEMMGEHYRVQKIIKSTDYTKFNDEVWLEVLDKK